MKILLDCCIPAKLKELKLPKIRTAEKLLNWLTACSQPADLLECYCFIEQLKLITVPSLFHMSVVIINWTRLVKLRTQFLLRHNHLGIRALAYPDGVKGVQPQLNVFNCVCTKILSKSPCELHYILNFVQENVRNCTRTLNSHVASEFAHFASSQTLARSPFRKFLIYHLWTPSIVKTWVRLCHGSVSNVSFRP